MNIDFEKLVQETMESFYKLIDSNPEVIIEIDSGFNKFNYKNNILIEVDSFGVIYYHKLYSGHLEFVKLNILKKSNNMNCGYFLQYFKEASFFENVLNFD